MDADSGQHHSYRLERRHYADLQRLSLCDRQRRELRNPGKIFLAVACLVQRRLLTCFRYSVAEIVAIWKEFETEFELKREQRSRVFSRKSVPREIKLEVRWFCLRAEISGVSGEDISTDLQELLETDETEIIPVTRVLAPAVLHADPLAQSGCEFQAGMPVKHFYCGRFWSVARRSLIPSNGLDGMSKRGRLYSKLLRCDMVIPDSNKTSTSNSFVAVKSRAVSPNDWKYCFEQVLKTLSLKDASTAAYDQGETLIGREKELDRITVFLRSAIRGDGEAGDVKNSIFLAGPPGVGKIQGKPFL